MSADKYPSILLRQMKANVYIIHCFANGEKNDASFRESFPRRNCGISFPKRLRKQPSSAYKCLLVGRKKIIFAPRYISTTIHLPFGG